MKLEDIATISGKGGLFKILKPAKSGVILESMDDAKTKLVATAHHKLSVLSEISIYTTTKEGTAPLGDILKKMNKEFGQDLGLDSDADNAELKSFMKSVLPEYDQDRVYVSDIKKLVRWYDILLTNAPEIFAEPSGKAEDEKAS
ncbi:MAG: DUF5606 domain-containing protein [Cyclobacteriaceae bacterium]|nr:DUF5606 domain-containing protein [Cyclobacteriaceae bacterium]MBX2956927.1 DUF5606 domain-containing protein [Cyclobacteriaceae bacterium]